MGSTECYCRSDSELSGGDDRGAGVTRLSQLSVSPLQASDLGGTFLLAMYEVGIVANDPVALYPFLNAQATRAYSAAAFASAWTSQSKTLGRITALRRASVGAPQVTDQGFWYVAVEHSGDTSAPSGSATASFTAFFIHEPSGSKFWTTVRK